MLSRDSPREVATGEEPLLCFRYSYFATINQEVSRLIVERSSSNNAIPSDAAERVAPATANHIGSLCFFASNPANSVGFVTGRHRIDSGRESKLRKYKTWVGRVAMKPMISIASTTLLLEAIRAAGANPDQVLRAVGLDIAEFSNLDGFIESSRFAQLLEEAARATNDEAFGLHFGERFNPKNIGPLIYVVLNSPTIAAGIENGGRYLKIHNEAAKLSVKVEGEHVYIEHVLVDMGLASTRQQEECSMVVSLHTIRLMAGSDWKPEEVRFAHESPSQTAEHVRIFGAPVLFGCATNALVVTREFLERQVPAADPRLFRVLKRYVDHVVKEMPREDSLLAAVRKAIGETIRDGDLNFGRIAKKMRLSPRTLQRRLKEQGMGFKNLIDDTRRRFAINYMKDRNHSLTQIAFLLGYSEVSAFNRAFKRWTDSTPLRYRRNLRT